MQALHNVSVVDLTFMAPGAYCTMILSDLGAEVIKVEAPRGIGLDMVGSGKSPDREDEKGRRSAAFYAPNRGKKSIVLNLKTEEGLDIFKRIANVADVIVEGFRPGVMTRLGADYESLAKTNPRIIYCSISGYGQTGPHKGLPGHDVNYIAKSGILDMIGRPEGPPEIPLNLVGDFAGGSLFAAIGILTALFVREKTGRGQYVDASITDGAVSLLTWQASLCFAGQKGLRRGSTALAGGYPYYGVYATSDNRYISIGCIEPRFWQRLCHVLGKEEYTEHVFTASHFVDPADDPKWSEMKRSLGIIFRTRTSDEWFESLTKADVPVSKVNSIEELADDEQLNQREMVVRLDHPQYGRVVQIGNPLKLSETPPGVLGFSPFLGEHSDELLGRLGFTSEEVQRFRDKGAVA